MVCPLSIGLIVNFSAHPLSLFLVIVKWLISTSIALATTTSTCLLLRLKAYYLPLLLLLVVLILRLVISQLVGTRPIVSVCKVCSYYWLTQVVNYLSTLVALLKFVA